MIRFATIKDIPYIISLSKKEAFSLGFIPKPAYEAAITGCKTGKRWSTTCNDKLFVCVENNDLVGILVYKSEINKHPFPRSVKSIKALAIYRGSTCGCKFAESFVLLKKIS